jgi:hypothetical protein
MEEAHDLIKLAFSGLSIGVLVMVAGLLVGIAIMAVIRRGE